VTANGATAANTPVLPTGVFPQVRQVPNHDPLALVALDTPLTHVPSFWRFKINMTGEAERDCAARAHDLADLDELVEMVSQIIARARAARVDRECLGGLVDAVNALGGDPRPALRDKFGKRLGQYPTDAGMFRAIAEADDQLYARHQEIGELRDRAENFRRRARRDRHAGEAALILAHAMPVKVPCKGCHDRKAAAIAAAQRKIDDARMREGYAQDALDALSAADVAPALAGVRRVADDYEETYAEALDLVRADPDAMPADGDFLTGYGSRLGPREVTSSAADLIRGVLQLAHGDGNQASNQPLSNGTEKPADPYALR
jgi:hypothetical protein